MNLEKLPKWAQAHIRDIQRQRDTAVQKLIEYCDEQIESEFYIDDMVCDGERRGPSIRRRYIQTHAIDVEHLGVHLRILLRDGHIDVSWEHADRTLGDVVMQPSSFQAIRIFRPKNTTEKN